MGSSSMTPPLEPSSPIDGGIRKRVCKACDRCRLKKSKCDGSSPCSRCKTDNAICVFGERKKSHDKVYPKGYVEMLENQQAQLVSGLQELYKRLQAGKGWAGAPLKETTRGTPLTHDILEALGALKQEGQPTAETFEENLDVLQQKLIASGAPYLQREPSFDTNSDLDQTSTYDRFSHKAPTFANPFQTTRFPPTPPSQSPHPTSAHTAAPIKSSMGMDFSHPQQFPTWSSNFDDEMELTYDPTSDMSMNAMMYTNPMFPDQTAINPCMTMKNWDAQQEIQRYFNTNILA